MLISSFKAISMHALQFEPGMTLWRIPFFSKTAFNTFFDWFGFSSLSCVPPKAFLISYLYSIQIKIYLLCFLFSCTKHTHNSIHRAELFQVTILCMVLWILCQRRGVFLKCDFVQRLFVWKCFSRRFGRSMCFDFPHEHLCAALWTLVCVLPNIWFGFSSRKHCSW